MTKLMVNKVVLKSSNTRGLRKKGKLWKAFNLCDICGASGYCKVEIKNRTECVDHIPTISFQYPYIGFDKGYFNTFRRSLGWYRRFKDYNGTVTLCDASSLEVVGYGEVEACYSGMLGELLKEHSHFNHLMLDYDGDTVNGLRKELYRIYGRNHAKDDAPFSVIYIRLKEFIRKVA